MKTALWIIIPIVLLVIIKIVFLSPKVEGKGPGGKGGAMQPSVVNVYVAKTEELNNEVFATGTVIANEEVILIPEMAGKITRLNINEGGEVNKGELLVKINDADLQAQLQKLELQAKINSDKVNREKQLVAVHAVSQEEYELAENTYNTTKADIDYTKAQISKTEIRAPFNAVIGLKYVSEGSYVSNTTRIASIQQINPVKIDFSVPEKYADVLKKGDVISFIISENQKIYQAKIFAVEPKIDQSTRTIQLRAIANNDRGELFPGSFAKIKLPLEKIKDAIMIPTQAIIPILKGKKVFICKNGKATEVQVETGIRTASSVQVVMGLQAGDSVITTGIMQLKPGALVKCLK